MVPASIQRRMGLLFLAFFLLVSISSAAFWTIETENKDALVINLAGRQRMLLEQITKEVVLIDKEEEPAQVALHKKVLQETKDIFDQTLVALIEGGQAPYPAQTSVDISATTQPETRAALDQVEQAWRSFDYYLDIIIATDSDDSEFGAAIKAVYQMNPTLLQQVDDLVKRYEMSSTQTLLRLRWIQVLFFSSAVLLLIAEFLVVQKSVVTPLRNLGAIAERIGGGDLTTPVTLSGVREIEMLAHNLDTMRTQLRHSHAELEWRVAQRTRELTTAFEISQEIVTRLDLVHLLPSITDRAQALMQAQVATLCLLSPDGAYLELAARSGETATLQNDLHQSVEQGLARQVIGWGQTVTVGPTCLNCHFLSACASGECVATPLRIGEQTLGALCVIRPIGRRFDPDETRALTLLANSAAIAIANARLVETERRRTEQAATLAERKRLATEFHDHLAQTLSFLNFKADQSMELLVSRNISLAEAELGRMKTAIDGAYTQVRTALTGLREPVIAGGDLAEQLVTCLTDFREQTDLPVELNIDNPDALVLTNQAQGQAMLIVREALANIRRHAQAGQVWVSVTYTSSLDEVCFVISDDGCGFDTTDVEGENHLGLKIMQARAERSDGRLSIESAPGAGTKVVAYFPLVSHLAKNGK